MWRPTAAMIVAAAPPDQEDVVVAGAAAVAVVASAQLSQSTGQPSLIGLLMRGSRQSVVV